MHRLAGGEHAWRLLDYERAIRDAGLEMMESLGPWDSVVNAYPAVRNSEELHGYARAHLIQRFGILGRYSARMPGIEATVWRRIDRPTPGRLYTFRCRRPLRRSAATDPGPGG